MKKISIEQLVEFGMFKKFSDRRQELIEATNQKYYEDEDIERWKKQIEVIEDIMMQMMAVRRSERNE